MQITKLVNLDEELAQYINPDEVLEEVPVFLKTVREFLAQHAPDSEEVLFWDSENGGDPPLDLETGDDGWYEQSQLFMQYTSRGDYYGATLYSTEYNYQPVLSLWLGGCSISSATGFYVIPVQPPYKPSAQ